MVDVSGLAPLYQGLYNPAYLAKGTKLEKLKMHQEKTSTSVVHFLFMVGCRYWIIVQIFLLLGNLILCLIRAIHHLNTVLILLIHIFHLICLTVYPAQTLTDTLCKEIGKDDLTLNAKVLTLAYSHDGSSSSENWSITCTSNKKTQDVDAVIMTVSMVSLLFPFCSFPEYCKLCMKMLI